MGKEQKVYFLLWERVQEFEKGEVGAEKSLHHHSNL